MADALREWSRLMQYRQPVAPALFAGADDNPPPVRHFILQALGGRPGIAEFGQHGHDLINTQFHGLLDRIIHTAPARQGQHQGDTQRGFAVFFGGLADRQFGPVLARRYKPRLEFGPAAIEHPHGLPLAETQHVEQIMRPVRFGRDNVALLERFGDKKTPFTHGVAR